MDRKTLVILLTGLISIALLLSACGGAAPATIAPPSSTATAATTSIPSGTATTAPTAVPVISPTPSGPLPLGKYKGRGPFGGIIVLTFLADGTYVTAGGEAGKGIYVATGDKIVFIYEDPTIPVCIGLAGTYVWSFDGTALRFRKIAEACGLMADEWSGDWVKQP